MIKPTWPVQLIAKAIQIIIFVFGAFGGFILKVSPPDHANGLPLANGMVQFGALIMLLAAAAAVRSFMFKGNRIQTKTVKIWAIVTGVFIALFLLMGVIYYNHMTDFTVYQGKWDERFIKGKSMTARSLEICAEEKRSDPEDCESFLLNDYYSSDEIAFQHRLWKAAEVNDRKKTLFRDYIIMILSLCTALFSLVEYLTLRYGDVWGKENNKPGNTTVKQD